MDDLDFNGWNNADWDGVFADHHTEDVLVDWMGQKPTHGVQAHLYVAGARWSLGALQASMAALWTRDVLIAAAWLIPALGGWWITAGIGIRLGTSPRQFLAWLSGILGFTRADRRVDSD